MHRLARHLRRIVVASVAATLPAAALAGPAESGFTYQGRLASAGEAVQGAVDLRFTLYDAAEAGGPVGDPRVFDAVPVVDGVFTVEIDFGPQAIGAESRWIEVEVGDGTGYTALEPRQPLTAAPVAWFAMRPWIPNAGHYFLQLSESAGQTQRGVGIAVATPEARLHVRQAPFGPDQPALRVEDAFARSQLLVETPESQGRAAVQAWNGATDQAGPLSLNADGGNVGVGTADPLAKLHVAGQVQAEYMTLGNDVPQQGLFVSDLGIDTFGTSPLLLQSFTGGPVKATAGLEVVGTSDLTGNVEVGGDLDLAGALNLGGRVTLDDVPTRIDFTSYTFDRGVPALELANAEGGSTAISFKNPSLEWIVGQNQSPAGGTYGDFFIYEGGANENRIRIEQGGSHAGINLNGNVVVTHDLDVQGDVNMRGIEITDFDQVLLGGFPEPETNVGTLYVQGDTILSRGAGLHFVDSLGSTALGLVAGDDDDLELWAGQRMRVRVYEENNRGVLWTDTVDARRLVLRGGADIAEPFDVRTEPHDEPIRPGMVVAIDSANTGTLRVAASAYDRTVAGIISGAGGVNPGLMLRQEDTIADGEHPVALSGRVYVYVDADANGPVRPGDMLTTSATPGHAMKATDPQRSFGAIIGKAMSELDTGRGLVLVLVNLQ